MEVRLFIRDFFLIFIFFLTLIFLNVKLRLGFDYKNKERELLPYKTKNLNLKNFS